MPSTDEDGFRRIPPRPAVPAAATVAFHVVRHAVQPDGFERRMPRAGQCRLCNREIVADIGVELAGNVGHVENLAQLRHRLVDGLLGRSTDRP
eukprot:scaffold108954_cov68-Phaeocystis_antarctica.AAC.3